MNHITENALIAGTLLAVFVIPAVIITRRSKQKRIKALNQRLQIVLNERGLSLTSSQLLGNKIIGWAQSAKTLIFGTHDKMIISDLTAAVKFYVIKSMNGTSVKSIILQIANQNNQSVCAIPFYEQFLDNEMNVKELEVQAKSWETMLNSHLQRA
jgi:hypothetical protein